MVLFKDNDGNFDANVYYKNLQEGNIVVVDENEVYTIKDIQAYEEGTYYVLEVF